MYTTPNVQVRAVAWHADSFAVVETPHRWPLVTAGRSFSLRIKAFDCFGNAAPRLPHAAALPRVRLLCEGGDKDEASRPGGCSDGSQVMPIGL